MTDNFELLTTFRPAGDQPRAIHQLSQGLELGLKHQTLLGVTGSGKTFTIANVIARVQKPTLVIAHNKTLAAQLVAEFQSYFPKNRVEYFVSYFDYYQPEAYLPGTDTYIEKDSSVNDEIDRLRHAATAALLTRRDTIVVASVSCIYGLGSPAEYEEQHLLLAEHNLISRDRLVERLVAMHYQRTEILKRGTFRAHGETFEIMPPDRESIVRVEISDGSISSVTEYDGVTRNLIAHHVALTLFPAKHFIVSGPNLKQALRSIEDELAHRLRFFESEGKLLEAERLERRTRYDIELIREVGYCSGIENYSRHLTGRHAGESPYTLLDFFPKDFLLVIDESHVTVPQIRGMYEGDRSRKQTLVDYGFRLPSALDNRPLTFREFSKRIGQTIYISATPNQYELKLSQNEAVQHHAPSEYTGIAEQIVRPTGLIDPEITVRSVHQQVADLTNELRLTIQQGHRALVTTLTKKQAEQLTEHLTEQGVKTGYIHSEVDTLDRISILNQLRRGSIDVLVGVNLLREGLDLPEVALVGVLDADKEGFLRSETSLIQTMGRAARNIRGRVILYADSVTRSMKQATEEADRRRTIQLAYNKRHHITPRSIEKAIHQTLDHDLTASQPTRIFAETIDLADLPRQIHDRETDMRRLAKALKFEEAALVRDELIQLKRLLKGER